MGDEADYIESQVDQYETVGWNRDDFCQLYFKDTSKPTKDGLYQCTMCKQFKPKSEFYKDKRVPCGIRNKCKECYHK